MTTDIAAMSTELSQARLKTDVGVAVMKKSQDAAKQQGDAAIALLQAAVNLQAQVNAGPNAYGGSIDLRA